MSSAVPDGWDNFPLQDICFFQEGPGLRNWQYRDSGTKFINIRCIQDGDIDTSVAQHLSNDEVEEKYSHFLLNEGDYVLSSSGTIGRLALVKERHLPLLLNTSVIRFRSIDETRLDSLFLRHFLQSKQFFDKISEQSQGSAQVNFGPTHLKVIDALLPPLPEQKKIASILTSVDEVIENTSRQIDKLQDLKKATMNELLTKGIGHTEYKDSELGRIPKSWEVASCAEMFDFMNGKAFYSDGYSKSGYRVIDLLNISLEGRLNITPKDKFISAEIFNKYPKAQLRADDLIFIMTDITPSLGLIGKTAIIDDDNSYVLNQRVGCFRPKVKESMLVQFFNYLFNSNVMRLQVVRETLGTAQFYINTPSVKNLLLVVPPRHEQGKITSILKSIERKIDEQKTLLLKTQSLKKSLMQDLLTGKVRVSVN